MKYFNKARELLESTIKIKTHNNKPIFGRNVFKHASGMHQKAILENRESFEVLKAEKFGIEGGLVCFGKLSGKSALIKILKENNHDHRKLNIKKIIPFLKKEAEIKKILTYTEIKKIISKVK